jgi:hypothetical protein
MVRRILGGLALFAAVISSACATNRVPDQQMLEDGTLAPSVTVRNDNWLDVVIYAVRGSARFRVGTVGGSSTQTFRLPAQAMSGGSEVQILADPIGATRGYITDPVVLGPGQRLELQVGSPISISTFAVRNE